MLLRRSGLENLLSEIKFLNHSSTVPLMPVLHMGIVWYSVSKVAVKATESHSLRKVSSKSFSDVTAIKTMFI